jgi:hypothetical protein
MSEQETRQLREDLLKGLDITFDKLVEQKKRKNEPLAFSNKGNVVQVDASKLENK